jgi:hypothetical protein
VAPCRDATQGIIKASSSKSVEVIMWAQDKSESQPGDSFLVQLVALAPGATEVDYVQDFQGQVSQHHSPHRRLVARRLWG